MSTKFCDNIKHLIIKCDNSTSQNKNWLLFSNMIRFINDPYINLESITFDYYEAGHSYQAADSVHASISKKI